MGSAFTETVYHQLRTAIVTANWRGCEGRSRERQPADRTGGEDGEDREYAGIHQSTDHYLDCNGHKEREDRAEHGSHGDRQ
jgi:hypothetical protein